MSDNESLKNHMSEIPPCPPTPEEIQGYFSSHESYLNTAKSDKFLAVITLPACFDKINKPALAPTKKGIEDRTLYLTVFNFSIPTIKIGTRFESSYGRKIAVADHTRAEYDPISLKFAIDSRFKNYYSIYRWMEIIADEIEPFPDYNKILGVAKRSQYCSTIVLYGIDEYNKTKNRFVFEGAFPASISGIEYNYQTANEISVTVTFPFTFLRMEMLNQQ
jgi:hypothetical protein